jgi:RNA exonuclease 1
MGMSMSNESELIRLTAVDFFTKETLVDNLIFPSVPMRHYNTKYSGVTLSMIQAARLQGTCILGRDAAREALLQYIGPGTVLVVHGGSSDLTALRLLHPHVVDSFILEGYYGEKVEGGKGLKNLMKLKTGLDIQSRGKLGHDSLEDALAARELVLRFMASIPDR